MANYQLTIISSNPESKTAYRHDICSWILSIHHMYRLLITDY